MSQVLIFPSAPAIYASLDGVRRRRVLACLADFFLVSLVTAAIWTALLVLTLGLSWFLLPPLFPLVAFFYNGFSISGRGMGTPGMRMFGLIARMNGTGERAPFINAAAHGLLYYVSWSFPLVFLVSLVDSEKRCLHDILSGLIVSRRA